MANGHLDVNVPVALRGRLGTLLEALEAALEEKGIRSWRVEKLPGGHITPWWLYACLDKRAPKLSQVQFGETVHQAVNPTPHLWCQGKSKHLEEGARILRDFLAGETETRVALASFDGSAYGPEYLSFAAGARIRRLPAPEEADGWAFGVRVGVLGAAAGWFPPEFDGAGL